jgi:hypothetical protein
MIAGDRNAWPELQSLAAGNTAFLPDPRNWPTFSIGADVAGKDLDAFFAYGPDGLYMNINREVGLDQPMVSRGVATADVDGDGRMDFALSNCWAPSYFYHNASTTSGSYLALRLLHPIEPTPFTVLAGRPQVRGRPAFGAQATVHLPPRGRRLTREVDGGNGHTGRRSAELHFGLGRVAATTKTIPVTLRWRRTDGRLADPVTLDLAPDRCYTVVLGHPKGEAQ